MPDRTPERVANAAKERVVRSRAGDEGADGAATAALLSTVYYHYNDAGNVTDIARVPGGETWYDLVIRLYYASNGRALTFALAESRRGTGIR